MGVEAYKRTGSVGRERGSILRIEGWSTEWNNGRVLRDSGPDSKYEQGSSEGEERA